MLYALGDPLSLVLLLVSFLVAITVHGWVQALACARAGGRAGLQPGATRPDVRRHLDPFGAVGGAIAGVGWARPVELPSRVSRGALVGVLVSGALVNIALGCAALVGSTVVGGPSLRGASVRLLQIGADGVDVGPRALLLFGLMNLFVGVLSLLPLPPLDGGRLLFALAPRSAGWQKARYYLIEQNIGIAVVLALLLIPLGGPQALIPALLDPIVSPLARLVTGG